MFNLEKRKFIVASQDPSVCNYLTGFIGKQISQSSTVTAFDGIEAQAKIENDLPAVFVVSHNLPKKNAFKLIQWITSKKAYDQMAILVLSPLPDKEYFIDEVVTGRLQFFDGIHDETKITQALNKALNYSINGIAREFKIRFLSAGELLIREGEKAETVYIVKRGELNATVNRDSQELTLGKIEKGEFVGEMAYINGEARSADVTAQTDCELIEVPITNLDLMLFQKPAWSKALMKTLSKRIKIANQHKSKVA